MRTAFQVTAHSVFLKNNTRMRIYTFKLEIQISECEHHTENSQEIVSQFENDPIRRRYNNNSKALNIIIFHVIL